MSAKDTGDGDGGDASEDGAADSSYGRPLRIVSIVFALLLLGCCASNAALRIYANWPLGS